MPTRPVAAAVHAETAKVNNEVLNLAFLPEKIRERINETFDGYFGLGGFTAKQQPAPDTTPMFPNQLSGLQPNELGDHLGEQTAWYAYTTEKLRYVAVALQVVESEKDKALDTAIVQVAMEYRGKLTETERKSKAKLDEVYLGLVHYADKLAGIKTMLDNQAKMYDRNITTLSREVSRREHQQF